MQDLEHVGSADGDYAAAAVGPLVFTLQVSLEVLAEVVLEAAAQVEADVRVGSAAEGTQVHLRTQQSQTGQGIEIELLAEGSNPNANVDESKKGLFKKLFGKKKKKEEPKVEEAQPEEKPAEEEKAE